MDITKILRIASLSLSGLLAGNFVFVSAVDCRTLVALADSPAVGGQYFKVWWGHGADLMAPLVLTTAFTVRLYCLVAVLTTLPKHLGTFFQTKNFWHLYSSLSTFAILFYTMLVMLPGINSLRLNPNENFKRNTQSFAKFNHLRTATAVGTFIFNVYKTIMQ